MINNHNHIRIIIYAQARENCSTTSDIAVSSNEVLMQISVIIYMITTLAMIEIINLMV